MCTCHMYKHTNTYTKKIGFLRVIDYMTYTIYLIRYIGIQSRMFGKCDSQ